MAGAVLNAINTRLDASTVAFILDHGGAKVVLVDREFTGVMAQALSQAKGAPTVVWIDDILAESGDPLGECEYEAFLAEGDPDFVWSPPADEWQPGFLFGVSRLDAPPSPDRFTNGVRPPPGPSLGHAAREIKEATSGSCVHSMQCCFCNHAAHPRAMRLPPALTAANAPPPGLPRVPA